MAERTLDEILNDYDKLTGQEAKPREAGAAHYLKRGALQGISSIADVVPNIYNLGKAAIGFSGLPEKMASATGRPASDFMPNVGEANPIAQFLLRNYGEEKGGKYAALSEPAIPSASIGGRMGAAALEGLGAGVSQGPMALTRAPIAQMAKQLALNEVKSGVGGALGAEGAYLGGEATGGSLAGQILGGVLGGVVAPSSAIGKGGLVVGTTKAALDTMRDLKASRAGSKIEPIFSNYITKQVRGAAEGTPNAAENLTEGLRLRETIPGFNPSLAEMSNAPGLLDMQKKFALLSAKNLNEEVGRNQANAQAVKNYFQSTVPAAAAPSSVRSAVNQSLADQQAKTSVASQSVAQKLPIADQMELGSRLADIAQTQKTAARPGITAAYENAFRTAGDAATDAAPIVSKVEDVLGTALSKVKPENAPQTVSAIKRVFGDKTEELTGRSIPPDLMAESGVGPKQVTLKDLHDIRVAIGQDMAAASRSTDPISSTRLYNLNQVLPEVDAAIARLPQEAQQAYQAANNKYKTEFAPRFKEGTNLRVFKDSSLNEPKILPDKFVSEYFKPDMQAGGTRAVQFGKLFGGDAQAQELAKTGILDIYRQKVVDPTTGVVSTAKHDAFMRDYGRTLDSYKSAGVNALDEIKATGSQAAKLSSDSSKLSDLSKSLKFDTVDELVNGALKSPKVMANTLMRLSPERKQTFNSIILSRAFDTGSASGMRDFLSANQKTLSMTVPEPQLSAMRDIASALEMTERAPIRGNLASGGADMLKNMTGTSTATVFAQIRAVTAGRSSVEWGAINLAMPALNKMTQTSFASVMESALHSPQQAVALRNYLLSNSPGQAEQWAQRILSGMKMVGGAMWAAKGPIAKNFLGPEKYPAALAASGTGIRTQLQE